MKCLRKELSLKPLPTCLQHPLMRERRLTIPRVTPCIIVDRGVRIHRRLLVYITATDSPAAHVWRTGTVDDGTSSTQLHIVCHPMEVQLLRQVPDINHISDPRRRYGTEAEYRRRIHQAKDLVVKDAQQGYGLTLGVQRLCSSSIGNCFSAIPLLSRTSDSCQSTSIISCPQRRHGHCL